MRRTVFFVIVCMIGLGIALSIPRGPRASAQSYGPDVTTSGEAYSCGDLAGYPDGQAFDDSIYTDWASAQIGTEIAGIACIGQHFAGTYDIRQLVILQASASTNRVASVYWQYSDDGSTWHTIAVLDLPDDSNSHEYSDLPVSGLHQYWRIVAATNTYDSASRWRNLEIQMMEAVGNPSATPVIGPSSTPTITLTPSATTTPEGLLVGTFATIGYDMRVKPTGDFGQVATIGVLMAILGLLFGMSLLFILIARRGGLL